MFLPENVKIYWINEGKSWAEAVNIGFSRVTPGTDVLLMDDDIFLPPLLGIPNVLYQKADIFGFKLLFPDGRIQHAGGIYTPGGIRHRYFGEVDNGQANIPCYTCHVTTSLCYIKADALKELKGMTQDYPGLQFEDVDFCFRALKKGMRIMYIPESAIHLESASKKSLPMFNTRMAVNYNELRKRFLGDAEFVKLLHDFPQPVGVISNGKVPHELGK